MVTFSGKVSAQGAAGETVHVKVTNPAGTTTETVNAITDASGNYSVGYNSTVGTSYKAQASVDEDADYLAAQSEIVEFNITKGARTITLQVN